MRLGTRRSALALAQAGLIAGQLGDGSVADVEIVPMLTSGDADAGAGSPAGATDKSRWVAELEAALLGGDIDLAVHSAKDLPGEQVQGLELLGAPARAAAEDVLCGVAGLEQLPTGARVGTSSLRRLAQLRAVREDLEVVAIRGNVDTRLRKLGDPDEDLQAIVLAHAGLERLGRAGEAGGVLDAGRFVPAPGQGVLALQGRSDDAAVREAVQAITDQETFKCLLAERALARELGASCNTPLGAYAAPASCGCLLLSAWVGLPDGSAWIGDQLLGGFYDPQELGQRVAERMRSTGAGEMLRQADEMAEIG